MNFNKSGRLASFSVSTFAVSTLAVSTFAAVIGFATLRPSSANAAILELPIYQANMKIEQVSGSFAGIEQKVPKIHMMLTQKNGELSPSGLKVYLAGRESEPVSFRIEPSSVRVDQCGSKQFKATKVVAEGFVNDLFDDIVLVDDSNRTCQVTVPGYWTASVVQREGPHVIGTLVLSGIAIPSLTFQDFEQYVH